MIQTVGVECAEIEFDIRMPLFKRRGKVIAVESHSPFGSPRATGIRGIAVCLVLIYHHIHRNSLFGVSLYEFAEIICISLQITRILNEIVLTCQFAGELAVTLAEKFHLILVDAINRTEKQIINARVCIVMPAAHHRIVMIYFHPAWRRPGGNP